MELASPLRNAYFSTSARFTQPTFTAVCPHASDHTLWTGLGGDPNNGDSGLVQTGTDTDQSGLNTDFGWWELIQDVNNISTAETATHFMAPAGAPSANVNPNNGDWLAPPGHEIRANVQYQSPGAVGNTTGKITISLFDITDGDMPAPVVLTTYLGAPAYSYVNGRTAEWVDERGEHPGGSNLVDGIYYYLRKSTTATVWSAASTNGTSIYGAANESTNWIFSASAGATLENSSGVLTTAGGFHDNWFHCPGE